VPEHENFEFRISNEEFRIAHWVAGFFIRNSKFEIRNSIDAERDHA